MSVTALHRQTGLSYCGRAREACKALANLDVWRLYYETIIRP
jgi:hypothetical protein